ncbi:DUF4296 domain-containing protein [Xanthomarina sp. F2636L]|uniref:DUF4296 domain-containing protein n=1 Tax=Xanthomarina sp. F2636L TaxID=2996018 RepID=UPI00225E46DA|nr:DUF4296 domain-containing protein [Xanthomarina sp. F2636L]MCX7551000.1 DUF4296 domain-containing protein [Xanthomarina sp. F2636L]
MKKIIIALTLFVFITSCYNSEKPKKPKNLISKEKMVDILMDVSLINSAKGINKSIIENNDIVPDAFIYSKHQIDSTQFVLSNEYYTFNLKDYEQIINKVNDSLKTLRDTYNTLVEKEQNETRKNDSIKRSKRKNKGFLKEDIIKTKPLKNN